MANKFKEKQIEMEILSDIYEKLEREEHAYHTDYRCVGKTDVQRINYRTNEPMWEDEEHTIPVYEDDWQTVEIPDDEISEDNKLRIRVYRTIMARIEKMI